MLRFSGEPARALSLPPELPAGMPDNPRVMRLIDADSVSHGLAPGIHAGRASNQDMQLFLDIVQATARVLDPRSQVRCAASTETATQHLDLLTTSGNNQWSIRRGLDGADHVLLGEMNYLITVTARYKRLARHADLVILAGKDHIYAPPVRRLRLLGIPTWLVVPGDRPARSLSRACCAVTLVGPGSAAGDHPSAAEGNR